jgi:phosphopantothenoylcysteine decarboxylase/phosphopantothenate--cysteine ligase
MKRVVILGVSGSVAAYRAADLARDMMRAGFDVRVCLTDSAQKFVTADLFQALTGNPCLTDTFEEPVAGRMAHIDWARQASVLVIAPATANSINRIGFGQADDMLTSLALAYEGPVVVAPSMNPSMYSNTNTVEALERLRSRGAWIIEPQEGDVACGESGQGKLATNSAILEAVESAAFQSSQLKGQSVLITCGPTQEPIDEVRYLTNRSSGKMGAALAWAAHQMGATVTVVTGPVSVTFPPAANVIRVQTAKEMLSSSLETARSADWIFGVAAVADYRPEERISGKRRRTSDTWSLDLVANPDVIAELVSVAKSGAKVVGFAAEPSSDSEAAQNKLARKKLFAIAMNDISRADIGFHSEENELTLVLGNGGSMSSGKMSKFRCALWMIEMLSEK